MLTVLVTAGTEVTWDMTKTLRWTGQHVVCVCLCLCVCLCEAHGHSRARKGLEHKQSLGSRGRLERITGRVL